MQSPVLAEVTVELLIEQRIQCEAHRVMLRMRDRRSSGLSDALEHMVEHVLRDRLAERGSVFAGRPDMNAGEDARIHDCFERVAEAAEGSGDAEHESFVISNGCARRVYFAVPASDSRVGHPYVQRGQQTRVLEE